MKLSKRGEYGLRAMVDLAAQADSGGVVPLKDIAQREQIPVKFLEQILLTLKNAGLLQSKMGAGGGYTWPSRPTGSRWARSCACWTVPWRRSAASARWPMSRAPVRMRRPAACVW